jgi:hypothetical protein
MTSVRTDVVSVSVHPTTATKLMAVATSTLDFRGTTKPGNSSGVVRCYLYYGTLASPAFGEASVSNQAGEASLALSGYWDIPAGPPSNVIFECFLAGGGETVMAESMLNVWGG